MSGKKESRNLKITISNLLKSFIAFEVLESKKSMAEVIDHATEFCEKNTSAYTEFTKYVLLHRKENKELSPVYPAPVELHQKIEELGMGYCRSKTEQASYMLYCWAYANGFEDFENLKKRK